MAQMPIIVIEYQALSTKDNLTWGQPHTAAELHLFDSIFFHQSFLLLSKFPSFSDTPCATDMDSTPLWPISMCFFKTDFQEKKERKNNKKLTIVHKREERKERPSTHLPWSLGILSEESANRPSTGEEKTKARITSLKMGQGEFLKEKINPMNF